MDVQGVKKAVRNNVGRNVFFVRSGMISSCVGRQISCTPTTEQSKYYREIR